MSEENKEKSALVPRLRFPEFREVSGWHKTQLIQALKFQPGFPFPSQGFNSEGVGLRLIRNRDLRSDEKPVHFSGPYNDDFVVDNDDILVGMDGDFRPCVWKKGKALLNQRVGRVLPKEGSDQRFLFYLLSVHLKAIEDTTARTTVKHLSHSNVERICEPFPTWPEQQKIADCLSSLDELITAETQKLDALKTHKKGLMQQLFPREGETVPRLRFPEFRKAGEWEEKRLQDFATIVRGGSPRPIDEYITNDADGLNWLKIGDIDKESKFVKSTQEKVIPAALTKTRVVNPGDLILSNSMSFGRPYILKIKTCIHDGWIAVSEIDKSLYRDYLYYLMMTAGSQMYFANNAAGSGVQNLNADIIKLLPVSYPKKKEQQKIADCLSSLDDLITAQSQKVDALKTHKKGLMQQLFPVLDEVSA